MSRVGAGRRWRSVVAGLLALLLGWLVAPAAPPLYDGVGFPDEPYRYIVRPSNVRTSTAKATAASGVAAAVGGTNPNPIYGNSAEQGPQVALFLPERGLTGPSAARTFRLRAVPEAPSGPPPNASFNGNAYAVTATSDAGPVTLTNDGKTLGAIRLRATLPSNPGPVFEYRTTGQWRQLATAKVGNDIYQTALRGFGVYALAFVRTPATSARSSGGIPIGLGVLVVLVLVVMVGAVLVVRRSRGRAPG